MKKMSGWQKAGIFAGVGCLSIVVVLAIGLASAVFYARSTLAGFGDPTPKQVEKTIALPDPVAAVPQVAGAPATAVKEGEALRLTLDLEAASFVIRHGAPGGQVQVDGTYAPGYFELEQRQDADGAGRAPRTTIAFRSKAPGWARMLSRVGGGEAAQPTLTVLIPTGVPIDLTLRVSTGESRIDLGGLTLRELGLDLSMGNHRVDFSEPMVEGLRRVRLNARMGNVTVENLGNTGAATIDTSGSMGSLTADLGGAWTPVAGTDLSFTHSMGQLTLKVPTKVKLEADFSGSDGQDKDRPAAVDQNADPAAPVLRVRVATSMGESRVTRY